LGAWIKPACLSYLKRVKHANGKSNMKKVKHGGKRAGSGRKAKGKAPVRGIRMDDSQVKAVESWARKQGDRPGFSEAIRRLVAYALKHWK
jgi:hypothetical protein